MPNTITLLPTIETLSETVSFKATPTQKKYLIEAAHRHGLDLSDYSRNATLADANKMNNISFLRNPQPPSYTIELYQVQVKTETEAKVETKDASKSIPEAKTTSWTKGFEYFEDFFLGMEK